MVLSDFKNISIAVGSLSTHVVPETAFFAQSKRSVVRYTGRV